MPTEVVEQLLAERITEVAGMLGVTEATALRAHFTEDWGTDMARRAWADHADQKAPQARIRAEWVPVDLVTRLVAALGQAQLFAAVNTRHSSGATGTAPPQPPRGGLSIGEDDPQAAVLTTVWQRVSPARGGAYDPVIAARATCGLGLALHQLAADDMLDAGEVWVSGEVLTHSRDSLAAFAAQLRQRRWSPCPCGQDHGQDQIVGETLTAVVGDLAELHHLLDDATDDAPSPDEGRPDALSLLTEALGHELPELGAGRGPASAAVSPDDGRPDSCSSVDSGPI